MKFFRIHMLLTLFLLVLVLEYLTNSPFIVLRSLAERHDGSLVVHLVEPAMNR